MSSAPGFDYSVDSVILYATFIYVLWLLPGGSIHTIVEYKHLRDSVALNLTQILISPALAGTHVLRAQDHWQESAKLPDFP